MAQVSLEKKISLIRDAISAAVNPPSDSPTAYGPTWYWVNELYKDFAILEQGGKYYRLDYSVDDGESFAVTIGDMAEVAREWVPVKAAFLAGFEYGPEGGDPISVVHEKRGARNSRTDTARLQDIHDLAVANGAACGKGNALKAVRKTDDELVVRNYVILFGGRDLEGIASPNKNADGSVGNFFTENTEIDSSYVKSGALHVDFEHGWDPDRAGIDKNEVFGYLDVKSMKKDKHGWLADRVLSRRNQYVQYLETLIEEGVIGTSSEAVPGKAVIAANGEIKSWPLMRDSLTVWPMEPRMISENVLTAVKALAEIAPSLKSIINIPDQDGQGKGIANMPEPITMTEEQLTAVINQSVTKAIEDFQKAAPPVTKPAPAQVADNRPKFKSIGEQAMAVIKHYTTGERDVRLDEIQAAAKATGLNEAVGSEGGFLVEPDKTLALLDRVFQPNDPMDVLGRLTRQPVSGNGYKGPVVEETSRASTRRGGMLGYWLAEGGTVTASKPKFGEFKLDLAKVMAMTVLTDELMADVPALTGFINREAVAELRFQCADKVINGSGAGVPLGILNSPAKVTVAKEAGQPATTVLFENVKKMWVRMPASLRAGAAWFVNQDVEEQLIGMYMAVGTGGVPVYMPPGGISGLPYGTIWGRPVVPIEYAPTLGTEGDITFANLGEYMWIDKDGIEAATSIHLYFSTGEQALRFTYRANGAPIWKSAITPFKGSNTLSPIVTLATRA